MPAGLRIELRQAHSRGPRAGRRIERCGRGAGGLAAPDAENASRTERLLEIAAGLGADVPFFLFGGRALGTSRGDEIYPLPDLPRAACWWSRRGNRREHARRLRAGWIARLTKRAGPLNYGVSALCAGARREAGLSNDFEAAGFPAAPPPWLVSGGTCFRAGAAEAALAGSGSAVFGIFRNPAQARRAAK